MRIVYDFLIVFIIVFGMESCNIDEIDITNHDSKVNYANESTNNDSMISQISDYYEYINIADANIINKKPLSERIRTVMIYKMVEHISLRDSVYSLDLSQEEFELMGINKDLYEEVSNNIIELNHLIEEINKKPNQEIELMDYKSFISERKGKDQIFPRKAIKDVESQSGVLETGGNYWLYTVFYPTIDKTYVEFYCSSNAAPLPVLSCVLQQWNNVNHKSKTSVLNAAVTINLNLFVSGSGVNAKIGFKTSDSKGGVAVWEAKHH